MLAIVFAASAILMAVIKMITGSLLGLDGIGWGSYFFLMLIIGGVSTGAAWWASKKAVDELTLDTNPFAVALILKAVNHIVGNLMNQIQFFRQQVKEDGGLKREAAELIDSATAEAQAGLEVLNRVEEHANENNYKKIFPQ